ncbi:ATP-binding cassette domain-containing protein [Planococcus sp. MB-3u-03]|uniref:ATP-binding cassette domain-containing protein n=1 Tax=Planococcus sp. MB-3u-03 TaxID=2058136 RepID=UPI003FA6BD0D
MAAPLINIKEVSYEYEQTKALDHISMTVEEGDFLAILGPNGSGKSTLLKIMLGLIRPSEGSVELFGIDSRQSKHREWIGYVSQNRIHSTRLFRPLCRKWWQGPGEKAGLFHKLPKTHHSKSKKRSMRSA